MTPVGSGAGAPKLGLILPPTTQGELVGTGGSTIGTTGSAAEVAELWRRAEATGADSLWAVDHLFWPHPMGESLTTLAVAAGATSSPTLGTCVLQLPLRRPAAVAKQATALQLLSGGRFVLGVGVGIHEGEYARAGVDYTRRGALMDEGIAEMRRAWANPSEPPSDYVQDPTSSPVPLYVGGSSPAARRRAATVGDGWVPLFLTAEEYGPALAELRRETAEAGRDPDSVEAGVVVFACVGDDAGTTPSAGPPGSRTSTACRPRPSGATWWPARPTRAPAALQRFADNGARHILIMVAGSPAVEHFGLLRAAFTGGPPARILEEVPA